VAAEGGVVGASWGAAGWSRIATRDRPKTGRVGGRDLDGASGVARGGARSVRDNPRFGVRSHTLARHVVVGHPQHRPLEILIIGRRAVVEYKERLLRLRCVIMMEAAMRVWPHLVGVSGVGVKRRMASDQSRASEPIL
jgi:hypothetical protein